MTEKKTMKALSKLKNEVGLWMVDAEIPTAGPHEVVIKVQKTAICGTDLHIYNWDEWSKATIKTPMIVGHEFVGTIHEVGRDVTSYSLGDLVSGEGHIVCGRCRNCLAGRRHMCKDTSGVGVNRQGAFAEYICIPEINVWACDKNIDLDVLACQDPLGNAVHTALSFDLLGEDVLITGAGPIGIMALQIAKHCGARYTVITDVNPYRLELAKKLGVSKAVNVLEENLADTMKELNMKEGFDIGLEMSGNGQALNDMIANMSHGGKIAMLGIQGPDTKIDWNKIVFNMITLKGIYGREMFETWYKMTAMLQTGLEIKPIITHHFHYSEFEQGFNLMNEGNTGKVILNWE